MSDARIVSRGGLPKTWRELLAEKDRADRAYDAASDAMVEAEDRYERQNRRIRERFARLVHDDPTAIDALLMPWMRQTSTNPDGYQLVPAAPEWAKDLLDLTVTMGESE